jgi:hypothetical protein
MFLSIRERSDLFVMNKKVYVGVYAASLAFFLVTLALAYAAQLFIGSVSHGLHDGAVLLAIFGGLQFLIVYSISQIKLIINMWTAIQDGNARTTPGKAVGLLFIPFFNVYWMFIVWSGFVTDYNNYIERNNIPARPLSATLYTIFPLFATLSTVSLWLFSKLAFASPEIFALLSISIFVLTAVSNLFIMLALIAQTCDSVNALTTTAAIAST